MWKAIKRALGAAESDNKESAAAEAALRETFDLEAADAAELLEQGREEAQHLTRLNPYEDHYVRKVAHLLHVPNTDSMPARNRARG